MCVYTVSVAYNYAKVCVMVQALTPDHVQHPYILSPVLANYTGGGMMIVRELISSGSLRDTIYGQQFQGSVLQKYGQSQATRSRVLSVPDIAKYGRQVLEALVFLSEKGFPLGKSEIEVGLLLCV